MTSFNKNIEFAKESNAHIAVSDIAVYITDKLTFDLVLLNSVKKDGIGFFSSDITSQQRRVDRTYYFNVCSTKKFHICSRFVA